MGKPLIVSRNGGLPELVDDGRTGYIYRFGTTELDACIEKVMTLDDGTYQSMSECSVKKAESMFDMHHYIMEIESLYQKYSEKNQ